MSEDADASAFTTSQVLNNYYPVASKPSYASYRYSPAQQNALVLSTYPTSDTRYLCKPIIFNHKTYSKQTYGYECPNDRNGTDEDVRRLQNTFQALGHCDATDVYVDKTVLEIEDILKKAAQSDQSAYSCQVIFVLTHGDEGKLYAYDKTYPIGLLWKALTKNKQPNGTLAGKPKLFFIQACRGNDLDPGQITQIDGGFPETPTKRIPICADILIAYASFLGYKSIRDTVRGTWFIQTLCDCIELYKDDYDLLTMLTIVQHSIAHSKVFQVDKKQIPCVETTLTKKLYLTKKSVIVAPRITHHSVSSNIAPQRVLKADDREELQIEPDTYADTLPPASSKFAWLSIGVVAGILTTWMAKKLIVKG